MKIERPTSKQAMPPHAKRVFEGVLFDIYQWEQELFDGTTATFEKLKRRDTAIVVPVTDDGHVILLEQEQPGRLPFISFPGGQIEDGEDPIAAAKRELEEETGYISKEEFSLWYATQPIGKIDWAVYVFIARSCVPEGKQHLDGGEKISMKILDIEELCQTIEGTYTFSDEMALRFLKAKHDPVKMEDLKKLFGI